MVSNTNDELTNDCEEHDSSALIRRRRDVLTAIGAGSTFALAGCSGDGADGDGADGDGADGDGADGDGADGDGADGDGADVDFPTQDISIVIPAGPGGGFDTYARSMIPYLEDILGVGIQAFNVAGASGQIASEQVYNADDAHTMLIMNIDNTVLQHLTEDPDFDATQFTVYGQVAQGSRGIAVGPHTDIQSWPDLVEQVESDDPPLFAGTGVGGQATIGVLAHVSGSFEIPTLLDNMVVYDGQAETMQALAGGEADVANGTWTTLGQYHLDDNARGILVMTHNDEHPLTPDVPTFADTDVENSEIIEDMVVQRRILCGPQGIPEEHAEVLRDAISEVAHDEEFQEEMEERGRPVTYRDHEEAQQSIENRIEGWDDPELIEAFGG